MLTETTDINYVRLLADQLSWHYEGQARPRLDGLTDEEYRWEPVPGAWGIRPRTSDAEPGSGEWTVDFEQPDPEPAPVTTIGWRLAHVVVGVLGERSASHFDARFEWGEPDYGSWPYAGTADGALAQLDATYAVWNAGVRGMSDADLARQVGPAEGPWASSSMAELILHINRETIHHLAEVALLRDLYLRR